MNARRVVAFLAPVAVLTFLLAIAGPAGAQVGDDAVQRKPASTLDVPHPGAVLGLPGRDSALEPDQDILDEAAIAKWIDDVLAERARERGMDRRLTLVGDFPRQRVEVVRGAEAEVGRRFYRRGWTDGLPIVAPTLGRVEAMVRGAGGRPGTEVVATLEPLQGFSLPRPPPLEDSTAKKDEPEPDGYREFKVTRPSNNATIRDNGGNVSVSLTLTPGLRRGHSIEVMMDGQPIGAGSGTSVTLTEVDRGTHTVPAVAGAGGPGHVDEAPIPIITIHLVLQSHTTHWVDLSALYEIEVQIPVSIVVEPSAAARHDFGKPESRLDGPSMVEIDPRGASHLLEPDVRSRRRNDECSCEQETHGHLSKRGASHLSPEWLAR